jgi:long-chain acyl-CoA synthetase
VVTLGEVRAFAATRLAAFKRPEALVLVDELPETATGKVAKNEVRARVAEAADLERLW